MGRSSERSAWTLTSPSRSLHPVVVGSVANQVDRTEAQFNGAHFAVAPQLTTAHYGIRHSAWEAKTDVAAPFNIAATNEPMPINAQATPGVPMQRGDSCTPLDKPPSEGHESMGSAPT